MKKKYRFIFIVESRAYWNHRNENYSPGEDLFLTYDFGLKHEIESGGGDVFYVDSLCSQNEMQENNFLAAEFLKAWHYDKSGRDIFTAFGVPFGFAFRIEFWSEYLYYVRLRSNLEKIKAVEYQTLFVAETHGFVSTILNEMNLHFALLSRKAVSNKAMYFFDIHKYMRDALHGKSVKSIARNILVEISSTFRLFIDGLLKSKVTKKTIYAQIYHPTKKIIEHLKILPDVQVITSSLFPGKSVKKYFDQRLIPIRGQKKSYEKTAELLLANYKMYRNAKLILSDGTDITLGAYNSIERQVQGRVAEALRILCSVIAYVKRQEIHLEIMIANIGLLQTIVDCVLKTKNVKSYLIINGLMPSKFGDESKYASYINSYSEETKRNYYKNAGNVVCLGDPRMDDYIVEAKGGNRIMNRNVPTIGIGSSGFNNIDLNSYVAVEFDFMFDVLTAFQQLKNEGQIFSIIVKVRPNGVLNQYKAFVTEYFSDIDIVVLQETPISEMLQKCDLYISIYSQTLFEASCLGIPAIYYKKDKEYNDPPFDCKSELVTVSTVDDLKKAFLDFQAGDSRFDEFLRKTVMEKYIGPLDGKNLERNLNFIHGLLNKLTLEQSNESALMG